MSRPQPVGADESPLAPELTETVRAARAELERAILEAKLTDDPIRHSLSAQSSVLNALHRLFVEGSLALAQTLRDAQRPAALLSPDTERELLDRVAKAVPPAVQRSLVSWHSWIDRKVALAVGATGLALMVAGLGVGYLIGSSHSDAARLLATCQIGEVKIDKESGRRFCFASIWLDPAPQAGQGR